jgi:20S proteasome subunit beta 7
MERTQQPIVTGTSVLAITYAGGVMMAADTLCSYGSMAKYKDARRIAPVGTDGSVLIGAGGEYSDFQSIMDLLNGNAIKNDNQMDGTELCAKETWNYLRAVLYQRRNKMNPLWNDLIVAGKDFLGYVDKIGTSYTSDSMICTGFGSHLALPILRSKWRPNMTEGEARALLEDCMRVLFYRDCRALNRIQIGKCFGVETNRLGGVAVSEPFEIDTEWDSASFVSTKGGMDDNGDGGW